MSEPLLPSPGHEPAQSDCGAQLASVQEVPGVHVVGGRQLQVQRQHRPGRGVLGGVGGVVVTSRTRGGVTEQLYSTISDMDSSDLEWSF